MGNVEIHLHKRHVASFGETAVCSRKGTGQGVFESEDGMYVLVFGESDSEGMMIFDPPVVSWRLLENNFPTFSGW